MMQKPRPAAKDSPTGQPVGEAVRLRVFVRGAVQGVGFRPFVYVLAREYGLSGHVINTPYGVYIEVEGEPFAVSAFMCDLEESPPPHAVIEGIDTEWLPCAGTKGFTISESSEGAGMATRVLPDIAVCPKCLAELRDPDDRRYRYPFLNCTHCGPRYSIIQRAPYDRRHTTMARFEMCADCAAEYADPADRRFHAQPVACPRCGPVLAWWGPQGGREHAGEDALQAAVTALQAGQVVALKGLGGFQLLCSATNDAAVTALRARKQRPRKPFAVMFADLDAIAKACVVDAVEAALLASPQAPIVLLQARGSRGGLSAHIAPGGALTGAMLPCTPLHHLLMDAVGMPLVATSGNVSDEPICTDEHEAVARLRGIADGYLVHDRPIARAVDDAVARVIGGMPVILRNARGYAPLSLAVSAASRPVLALGGQLKNAVAIAHDGHIVLSQHIGDLETTAAMDAFEATIEDLCALYGITPGCVVADLHPDYRSTRVAEAMGFPVVRVQHHYAHVLSCMAEHGLEGPVLGIAWDGTGYGTDGTVWGGEFLEATVHGFVRRAHLLPFRLAGGERAIREPRRSALGLLHEAFDGDFAALPRVPSLESWSAAESATLWNMLDTGLNSPLTTSVGRLFDGVASLIGLCQAASFEGEAAMALEAVATRDGEPYRLLFIEMDGMLVLDWRPMVRAIAAEAVEGRSPAAISACFHAALAESAGAVGERIGLGAAVLTGGCFQNARLAVAVRARLEARELIVYGHGKVPPNDGGIAVGQAYFAAHQPEK
jgi:hydrogenase maturation protein HypF